MEPKSLRTLLEARTTASALHQAEPDGRIRCAACAHRCALGNGETGVCGVRFNRGGELRAPAGYVARQYLRPVETNTIYHVLPGAKSLTFGMYGCDLRCPYCQNWNVSQALREGLDDERPEDVTARDLVAGAVARGCRVICGAFNEPLIAAEWAREIFTEAKARGLVTGVITDGNTTPETLAYMRPVTDVYRVDLKALSPEQYRILGGKAAPVFEGIREAKRLGYWIELVTLVVPAFNDDPRGLREMAREVAAIDPAIPWHLNAFYPRYRMRERPRTPAMALFAAAGSAMARGMKYVYAGNLPELRGMSHTRCADCRAMLVERADYSTIGNRIAGGSCPDCGAAIPGIWSAPVSEPSGRAD